MNDKGHSFYVLIAAILAVSTAAPLAKFCADVHPIAIGMWRTLLVGCLLGLTVKTKDLQLHTKDWVLAFLAGSLLAGHFWSWFASLHHISTLRSTVLVCLSPVWTGILEGLLLKRMPARRFWLGIGCALIGVACMSGDGFTKGNILGDSLALLGGLLGAIYLIVGRVVRQRVDIGPYGAIICLSCACWLWVIGMLLSVPFLNFQQSSWIALLALALGPQLTGHIGLNYAMRYIAASTVAMLLLLEPIGAAIISGVFLNDIPSKSEVLGSFIILLGLLIGINRSRAQR